jgi:hypothetical protein
MTLNQVIKRLESISLAHNLLRNFYFGRPTDFLTDKTTNYASAFLQDVPGTLDITTKSRTLGFKLFLLDLVHVSDDTKSNELDVQSDMLAIGEDLVSEFNHSSYTDWKVGPGITVTLVREEFDDMVAGAVLDFTVITPYGQDACVVPTDSLPGIINSDDMKLVYDTAYTATGAEGSTLAIPEIVGKKVVLIIRENAPLHKVSNNPISSEYTWNNTIVSLGAPTTLNERYLILYRNY